MFQRDGRTLCREKHPVPVPHGPRNFAFPKVASTAWGRVMGILSPEGLPPQSISRPPPQPSNVSLNNNDYDSPVAPMVLPSGVGASSSPLPPQPSVGFPVGAMSNIGPMPNVQRRPAAATASSSSPSGPSRPLRETPLPQWPEMYLSKVNVSTRCDVCGTGIAPWQVGHLLTFFLYAFGPFGFLLLPGPSCSPPFRIECLWSVCNVPLRPILPVVASLRSLSAVCFTRGRH